MATEWNLEITNINEIHLIKVTANRMVGLVAEIYMISLYYKAVILLRGF